MKIPEGASREKNEAAFRGYHRRYPHGRVERKPDHDVLTRSEPRKKKSAVFADSPHSQGKPDDRNKNQSTLFELPPRKEEQKEEVQRKKRRKTTFCIHASIKPRPPHPPALPSPRKKHSQNAICGKSSCATNSTSSDPYFAVV